MTDIYLVRHGQASFGKANYDKLSELGGQQAIWLGDYFKHRNVEFDAVFSGDMVRHHETKEGIASGKVQMMRHMDYLDYEDIRGQISEVDTVYWAIGTSSVDVDEETYGRVHVDFPMQFVREWNAINHNPGLSFHFISSSDISEDFGSIWVREKIHAEKSLFSVAEHSNLRVIAHQPD